MTIFGDICLRKFLDIFYSTDAERPPVWGIRVGLSEPPGSFLGHNVFSTKSPNSFLISNDFEI